jgi:D-alanyl-D-alanine dipeptidase
MESDIVADVIRFLVTVAVTAVIIYLAVTYVWPVFSFDSFGPGVRMEEGAEEAAPLYASDETAGEGHSVIYIAADDLELPVVGATGYAPVRLNVTVVRNRVAESVGELEAGTAFLITSERDDWWEVYADGVSGWVRSDYCLINLPDVIPSIVYNNSNASRSLFVSSGRSIPGVTGEKLYDAYSYNERLERDEYIMPVMYAMAKKIHKAQRSALAEGNTLVLYEAFRPYSVQRQVNNALNALAGEDSIVNAGINTGSWSLTWFISSGTSIHQEGCAIDVSLATVMMAQEVHLGEYVYSRPSYYYEFTMPSPIHELSARSATLAYPVASDKIAGLKPMPYSEGMKNSEGAKKLQKYCMDAGLSTLASEWWHFNDMETRRNLPERGRGNFVISECFSVAPEQVYLGDSD